MEDFNHAVHVLHAVADACEGGHPEMIEREYQKVLQEYWKLNPEERAQVQLPVRPSYTLGQSAFALAFTANSKLHKQCTLEQYGLTHQPGCPCVDCRNFK